MKIDMEVSDPVDFSSGDHQHLVNKAAIKGNPGRLDQPFTTSSGDSPQGAIKYSYPRSRDGTNTYAVQISEDVTPSSENIIQSSPFETTSIRRGFIVKVFVVLSVQLFITAAIISIFVFCKAVRKWVIATPEFLYALFPAILIVMIILACCRDIRRQVPMNYILLTFFTILEGLLLGSISVLWFQLLQSGRDTMGHRSHHCGDISAHFVCATNKMGFYPAKWSDVCFHHRATDLRDYFACGSIILVASGVLSTWNAVLLHVPGDGRADDGGGALPLCDRP
ncbi:protein lifeguard 1-like isoform X3 [Mastomys coucha]|uniref:protein lifeguard 1-like isoform X3 n=1 Tax=Mastomys coucha TaxID=35658 RepID=UPI001261D02A|nr:protein lifeguard 1-like isoform X3 [Mastomys coucha]